MISTTVQLSSAALSKSHQNDYTLVVLGLSWQKFTVSKRWIISNYLVSAAWGPLGWLVPSEIQPLNTRSAGQSITVFTQLISGATVTQTFLMMLCSLQWGVFLFCKFLRSSLWLQLGCISWSKGILYSQLLGPKGSEGLASLKTAEGLTTWQK